MEGLVIPEISQLSAHALHSILKQFASILNAQQAAASQQHSEVLSLLAERPTLAQATSLFSVSPAPEFVHLGALQALDKSFSDQMAQLKDQLTAQEQACKRDQHSLSTRFQDLFGTLRAALDDIRHTIGSNQRRNDSAYLAKKEKARKVAILRGWTEVHETCKRQRAFLKRFFQAAFKLRLGRKFGDWKHAAVSVRLKNVEMNIARCSMISQDCSKQLAVVREE